MKTRALTGFLWFVMGSSALCVLATLQKTIIGASFDLIGYIVPFFFVGITSAVIGLKKHSVNHVIKQLKEMENSLEKKVRS